MEQMINNADLPPIKVGFALDGVIVDILHTDERLAGILLSNPIILDITENDQQVQPGWTYNSETGQLLEPPIEEI